MEQSRDTPFPDHVRTRVWEELPDPDNAWLATGAWPGGGSGLEELML